MTTKDLKEKSQYQREQWDFTVLAKTTFMLKLVPKEGIYS